MTIQENLTITPEERKLRKEQLKKEKLEKLARKKEANKKMEQKTLKTENSQNIKSIKNIDFEKTETGEFKKINVGINSYDVQYTQHAWTEYYMKYNIFQSNKKFFFQNDEINKNENIYDNYKYPINENGYSVPLPPPNITGKLHLGHSMMLSIQDSVIRYKRLCGYNTCFIPGLDHAGIATQNVVEKTLSRILAEKKLEKSDFFEKKVFNILKEENLIIFNEEKNKIILEIPKNYSLSKEIKLKIAHEWSKVYSNCITSQLSLLNSSFDLNRQLFTMDPYMVNLTEESFISLFNLGLIFREPRIVNWCSLLNTTLSDLEVDNKTVESLTVEKIKQILYTKERGYFQDLVKNVQGCIYQIKYPVISNENLKTTKITSSLLINSLKDENNCLVKIVDESEDIRGKYFKDMTKTKFPIESLNEVTNVIKYVLVETTRPETILGDTALCYNPLDLRYKILRNYKSINPLTLDIIEIVENEAALIDFGTGILKVTPSHDPTDFEIGRKSNLRKINILTPENLIKISEIKTDDKFLDDVINKFENKNRFIVRHSVVSLFEDMNVLSKIKNHAQTIPICSRSGDIVESSIKDQWWCRTKKMCERVLEKFDKKEFELFPKEGVLSFKSWLVNPRDWCLSRQLWWGHRIPAYKIFKNNVFLKWIVCRKNEIEEKIFFLKKAENTENITFEQDEDVLDTWFSSGLWAIATSPAFYDKNKNNRKFDYGDFKIPHSLLETGSDITFFWVCRMLMLTITLTENVPFKHVLLHGIVRDSCGRKMSKSLGNVIDPSSLIFGSSLKELENSLSLTLSEKERNFAIKNQKKEFSQGIKEIGSDALRFGLCNLFSNMKDINLSIDRLYGYRKYCNKLWNGVVCLENLFENGEKNLCNQVMNLNNSETKKIPNIVNYIISLFNKCIESFHAAMESYNLNAATNSIYEFSYFYFDNFLEFAKFDVNTNKKNFSLQYSITIYMEMMKVLSIFMPFVTEELFQRLLVLVSKNNKNNKIFDSYIKNCVIKESVAVNKFPLNVSVDENEFSYVSKGVEMSKEIRSMKFQKDDIVYILNENFKIEKEDLSFDEIVSCLTRMKCILVEKGDDIYKENIEEFELKKFIVKKN